jgi:hypothetical protein
MRSGAVTRRATSSCNAWLRPDISARYLIRPQTVMLAICRHYATQAITSSIVLVHLLHSAASLAEQISRPRVRQSVRKAQSFRVAAHAPAARMALIPFP